jgi:hypothetical protein
VTKKFDDTPTDSSRTERRAATPLASSSEAGYVHVVTESTAGASTRLNETRYCRMFDQVAESPVKSPRSQPRSAGMVVLARALFLLAPACSTEQSETVGQTLSLSLRTPIPAVIESDGRRVEGTGTLFFSIHGGRGASSPALFVDDESTVWYWATEEPNPSFETSRNFPWRGRFAFGIEESSRRPTRPIVDRPGLCEDECSLRFYYTEQEFNGRDGQISDWERDRGDLRMWDEAPELWRYAEFEYRFSDRVEVSFVESFDDETGRGVLQLGLVTIDVSGDGMVVEMRAHPFEVFDWYHPAITPPVPDVSEFPEETDAEWGPE